MSWFGLSRIIGFGKPVTKDTFSSITDPVKDLDGVREVMSLMKSHFKAIHQKYVPWISTIPLCKGMVWQPTWKATPNDDRIFVGRGLALPKVGRRLYLISLLVTSIRLPFIRPGLHQWKQPKQVAHSTNGEWLA